MSPATETWFRFCLLGVLVFLIEDTTAAGYYGKLIGRLAGLEHQVRGDVYAVDSRTIHVKGFSYDGTAPDAFFYVGKTGREPHDQGIIVPNEKGSKQPLGAYRNQDVTLTLPDGLTMKDVAWFSIWCRAYTVNFGHLMVPRSFDYPRPQKIGSLPNYDHGVSSDRIVVVDAQTFLIPNFHYDGSAPDAFFWVGKGGKPDDVGIKVPDENGSLDPLKKYSGKTIVITLPGDMTVFDINYLSIWCRAFYADFGHVLIPKNLNVPPSLKMLGVAPQTKLNCEVLDDSLAFEVRWAVAGDSIVMQLVGKIDNGEYMAFGLSGSNSRSVMVGGDVTVAWLDQATGRGEAVDYILSAKSQCQGGAGSCPDNKVAGGTDNVRLLNAAFINDFSMLTFQRPLVAKDSSDVSIATREPQAVIWAIGPVNSQGETSYHRLRLRGDMTIDFGRSPSWNCPLPQEQRSIPSAGRRRPSSNRAATPAPVSPAKDPWFIPAIPCYEPEDGVFYAQIGPTGGDRGYNSITGHVGWGIAWYINGLLIPEINVVRGKTYTFVVEGGSNPSSPAKYHPFYITDDPEGGYEFKTDAEKSSVTVFAGVDSPRTASATPSAFGRLCEWKQSPSQSANDFESFGAYQRSLTLDCQEGQPGILQWTPDRNTPDTVYYQCFTHRFLGWKMNVVDRCDGSSGVGSSPATSTRGAGQRPDFDYYLYDDYDTTQTAYDDVTIGGSTRYESKVKPDDVAPSKMFEYSEIPSFESFPFDMDTDPFVSTPSNRLYTKEYSSRTFPRKDGEISFPNFPPIKMAKGVLNATAIQELTKRKKFNNHDSRRPQLDYAMIGKAKPTEEKQKRFWKKILTRPKYVEKDVRLQNESKFGLKIPNYFGQNPSSTYNTRERLSSKLNLESPSKTSKDHRISRGELVKHFTLQENQENAVSKDIARPKRKEFAPKYKEINREKNVPTEPSVVITKAYDNRRKYLQNKPSTHSTQKNISLVPKNVNSETTREPLIYLRSVPVNDKRETSNPAPKPKNPPQFINLNPNRKDPFSFKSDPVNNQREISSNLHRPEDVPQEKREITLRLPKLNQDSRQGIDPLTGLPFATNKGFNPNTIVYENDFRPLHNQIIPFSTNSESSKEFPMFFEISPGTVNINLDSVKRVLKQSGKSETTNTAETEDHYLLFNHNHDTDRNFGAESTLDSRNDPHSIPIPILVNLHPNSVEDGILRATNAHQHPPRIQIETRDQTENSSSHFRVEHLPRVNHLSSLPKPAALTTSIGVSDFPFLQPEPFQRRVDFIPRRILFPAFKLRPPPPPPSFFQREPRNVTLSEQDSEARNLLDDNRNLFITTDDIENQFAVTEDDLGHLNLIINKEEVDGSNRTKNEKYFKPQNFTETEEVLEHRKIISTKVDLDSADVKPRSRRSTDISSEALASLKYLTALQPSYIPMSSKRTDEHESTLSNPLPTKFSSRILKIRKSDKTEIPKSANEVTTYKSKDLHKKHSYIMDFADKKEHLLKSAAKSTHMVILKDIWNNLTNARILL